MPQVPIPEQRVELRPLPDQRMGPAPGPEAFGAQQGAALAQVGGTVAQAGAGTLRLALAEHAAAKQRAEEALYVEADNKAAMWEQKYLRDPTTGVLNQKGKQALELPDTVRAEYEKVVNSIAQDLHGERLQLAWRRRSLERGQRIDATVQEHVARENDAYETATLQHGIALSASAAGQNYDQPERVYAELMDGIAKTQSLARRKGFAPGSDGANDMVMQFTTLAHANVINQLLTAGQDKAAQEYFTRYQEQISGDAQDNIKKQLESGSVNGDALRTSAEVWQTLGPKNDDAPIELDKMEAKVRETFANEPNTKRYDQTMSYLRTQAATTEASRKERDNAQLGGVYEMIANGASFQAVAATPQYKALNGRARLTIQRDYERQAQERLARANAATSLIYTRESQDWQRQQRQEAERELEGAYMYYQYARPEILTQMKETDIYALRPVIGARPVDRLLDQWRKYKTDPVAGEDFRSDQQVVDGVLRAAEIDPSPPDTPANKPARARVAFIREMVGAEQRRLQADSKKKLTNQQLEDVTKDVLGRTALTGPGWIFGPEQKAILDFTYNDIPANEREEIRQMLITEKKIAKPTPKQILDTWRIGMLNPSLPKK